MVPSSHSVQHTKPRFQVGDRVTVQVVGHPSTQGRVLEVAQCFLHRGCVDWQYKVEVPDDYLLDGVPGPHLLGESELSASGELLV